eukprot:5373367-Pyramimonas_sp.AAC.2
MAKSRSPAYARSSAYRLKPVFRPAPLSRAVRRYRILPGNNCGRECLHERACANFPGLCADVAPREKIRSRGGTFKQCCRVPCKQATCGGYGFEYVAHLDNALPRRISRCSLRPLFA